MKRYEAQAWVDAFNRANTPIDMLGTDAKLSTKRVVEDLPYSRLECILWEGCMGGQIWGWAVDELERRDEVGRRKLI